LQKEAIRSLSETQLEVGDLFLSIAQDPAQSVEIRAEAILGLSKVLRDDPLSLLPLMNDKDPAIRREILRALRQHAFREPVRGALEKRYQLLKVTAEKGAELECVEYALFPPGIEHDRLMPRPENLDEWKKAVRAGGDPLAGERIFFSSLTQCSSCHLINHRGRRIGPELSNLGQSVSREQIIHSIIRPSDQYPPQFQAWFVDLKKGDYYQGLQLDHKSKGAIELYTTEGITRHFNGEDIASYGVLAQSLMPDGLEQTMTVSEMRDLVSFLESLK